MKSWVKIPRRGPEFSLSLPSPPLEERGWGIGAKVSVLGTHLATGLRCHLAHGEPAVGMETVRPSLLPGAKVADVGGRMRACLVAVAVKVPV